MEEVLFGLIVVLLVITLLRSLIGDLMQLLVPVGNWISRSVGLQGVPGQPKQHSTGVEGALLKEAVVLESFQKQKDSDVPRGRVRYNGEIWQAFYDGEEDFLPVAGDRVQIRSVEGLQLAVTPV